MDSSAASTLSDSNGRFLLCNIPQNRVAPIVAYVDGKDASVQVPAGPDADIDLEVK
jgi:hypothetical protein